MPGVVKSASGSAEKPSSKICPTCGERFGMDALFCPNDGSPLSIAQPGEAGLQVVAPDPYLGRELSGHIEIRQLVGVGAMGRVYRAFQKGIDRDVAVKILHRELSANQQLVSRFHREAKVASRLLHPNVVGVHLVGQLPDGSMYIVMEYLDGLSLQSALAAAGGAFDLPRALHVALQLCDATGEAHATGVVHRDLKPENVMLVRRGADNDFVKVLDFGIARLNWGEQSMATAAGLIFGTARYISPEGAQGEAVGPTGDVYATATLVYQMLAGRTPFEGEQAVALLVQQIHDSPPPLKSIARASYVPEYIADVVMKNLAKDPLQREPDGRALGRALLDAARLAGLSPEDFVARPMLSSKPPAVHLPPIQRTDKLHLVPEKSPVPAPKPSNPKPMPDQPAALETTLDDVDVPEQLKPKAAVSNPPAAAAAFDRTQAVRPLEDHEIRATAPLPVHPSVPPRESRDVGPVRGSMPSMDDPGIFEPEPEPLPPETPEQARRRGRSRAVFLFVACFLIGGIVAAFAWKMGVFGPKTPDETSLQSYHQRAAKAFHAQHFDSPSGDNVRDLTNEGLARYPHDTRLLEIRAEATDELVKNAVAEKYLGHMDQAAHLAQLAHELDPSDVAAEHLAAEYAQPLNPQAITDAGVARDAQTNVVRPTNTTSTAGSGTVQPPQGGARATIDLSPAPAVLVPVAVTIHISVNGAAPKNLPESAMLTASGPNVPPGTMIPILAEGPATIRGALTFNEAGKFELTFTAKVDGTQIKVTRVVNLAAPGGGGGNTQAPDGGKWL
jgi:serine/threonine-protein kinase